MKKIKYIIFALIIIIVILIILLLLNFSKKKDIEDDEDYVDDEEIELIESKESIQLSDYFNIKECIQKYIDFLNKNNSIYYEKQQDGSDKYIENIQKETIYSVLNESFTKKNNLNKDNLLQRIQLFSKKQRFYPLQINVLDNSDISVYKVYGVVQDLEYEGRMEVFCILLIDNNEHTFNIIPIDSKTFDSYSLNKDIEKIQNNKYNTYNLSDLQGEQIAIEYFEAYRFLTLANPKYTYEKMSEQYRKKRYGSLENYMQYIKDNYNEFKSIIPQKYLLSNNGEYTQYVIQDQYQNYYIFDTIDSINYNVSLDTYTIDTEKFITTYNGATNEQKVQMNIDKFFQMINRQDYRTSYFVLDQSFKTNKLNTQLEFENIMKNKLFKYNNISFIEFKDLGSNTYSYNIKLTDLTETKNDEINMTIIMQLKDNTDFVMSFSFN